MIIQWGKVLSSRNDKDRRTFSIPFSSIPIVIITPWHDRRGARSAIYDITKIDFSFSVYTAEDTFLGNHQSCFLAIGY
ncbi:gp53-like domain-containing protein [Treponema pectinovorum]